MIEMMIEGRGVGMTKPELNLDGSPSIIFLKEKIGKRYLPVSVSRKQSNIMSIKLSGKQEPRPLPHDIFLSVNDAFGSSIDSVVVSDIKNGMFYAKLILTKNDKKYTFDSQLGDAIVIAIASHKQVPIYATESVMKKEAIVLNDYPNNWAES
jgi:bifunctional DNase/RNase